MFYIDPANLTWLLYLNEYYLNGTNDYVQINSGGLIKGAPPAKRGGVSSIDKLPGVKLDRPMTP